MWLPRGVPIPADDGLRQQLTTMRITMAARAKQAMQALSRREHEALELWNAGMDYQEIAARTSQSPDGVGAVLVLARHKLVSESDRLDQ